MLNGAHNTSQLFFFMYSVLTFFLLNVKIFAGAVARQKSELNMRLLYAEGCSGTFFLCVMEY